MDVLTKYMSYVIDEGLDDTGALCKIYKEILSLSDESEYRQAIDEFVSVGGKRGLRKVSKTEVKDTVINSDTPELNDFLSAFEVTV